MKILFVNPAYKDDVVWNIKYYKMPPIGLATLATCTPEEYDVKIIDENVSKIDYNEEVDLVAITSITPIAPRAYEISQNFRKLGKKVIIGGIHPSMFPEEAKKYADSVVIGESETIWPMILEDFKKNKLKRSYLGKTTPPDKIPIPRNDLLDLNKYSVEIIQTSRGCPFNCEFCSVNKFNGTTLRQRPIQDVIKEVEIIKKKKITFVDDNLIGFGKKNEERAIHLFNELKQFNIRWGSQTSINMGSNDDVLKAASDSGAFGFFIGMESINSSTLNQMKKWMNIRIGIKNYKKVIKKIHNYGITITGSFVLGNDTDNKDIFKKTIDFADFLELDRIQFTISTPFPGTELYKRLHRENRLIYTNYPSDWKLYDFFHAVFKPKYMTSEELEIGMIDAYQKADSLPSLLKRAIKTFLNTKSSLASLLSFVQNRGYVHAINELHKEKISLNPNLQYN